MIVHLVARYFLYGVSLSLLSLLSLFYLHPATIFLLFLLTAVTSHSVSWYLHERTGFIRVLGARKTLCLRHTTSSSLLLGHMFALGLLVILHVPTATPFGLYFCALSIFHLSEFVATYLTNPLNLCLDSFLLNHSVEYWVAAGASWCEYVIESHWAPGLKQGLVVPGVGLILLVVGEVVRKMSMFTAGRNFSHLVQHEKQPDHGLITDGIYAWCRHPAYVGWFMWSVGTQLLLCNPVCAGAYALVSWRFFNARICEEERLLIEFFQEEYLSYQERTGTGIPGIQGYSISREEYQAFHNID